MDGNNPGHAKRVALVERTLAAGATMETDVFNLYSYDRIGGTLHCTQAATIKCFQGPSSTAPKYLDYLETQDHLGGGDIGQASKLNFESFSAEGAAIIRVVNTGSSTATVRLAVELRCK